MIATSLREELLGTLEQLPAEMQRRVLDFADALARSTPRGAPGKNLLQFAGILDEDTARALEEAIEEGCEKVDPRAW